MAFSNSIALKAAGLAVLACGAGAVIYIGHHNQNRAPESITTLPAPVVHTADWYVAHPDVLKVDEHKCAGDASSMTPAACQNTASADARLSVLQFQHAAAANGSASNQSTRAPQ